MFDSPASTRRGTATAPRSRSAGRPGVEQRGGVAREAQGASAGAGGLGARSSACSNRPISASVVSCSSWRCGSSAFRTSPIAMLSFAGGRARTRGRGGQIGNSVPITILSAGRQACERPLRSRRTTATKARPGDAASAPERRRRRAPARPESAAMPPSTPAKREPRAAPGGPCQRRSIGVERVATSGGRARPHRDAPTKERAIRERTPSTKLSNQPPTASAPKSAAAFRLRAPAATASLTGRHAISIAQPSATSTEPRAHLRDASGADRAPSRPRTAAATVPTPGRGARQPRRGVERAGQRERDAGDRRAESTPRRRPSVAGRHREHRHEDVR